MLSDILPLDKAMGTLLLGSWANTALYMLEIVQIWIYLSKYKYDPFLVRLGVAIAFISDTACSFTIYALVYLVSSTPGGVHI